MSYMRSNLVLGGKRLTVREAAAMQGLKVNTIAARLSKGWTRRQVLGLDPPPGKGEDFDLEGIAEACQRLEREHGHNLSARALEGDQEALGTLAASGVTLWDHCHTALLGSEAQAQALRTRPTQEAACGCTVDAATGVTVRPCQAHKDEAVRRSRRREIERERKLVATVNVVRGL